MTIKPFIDEVELEDFGFCPIEDRFYKYLAVRGGMFNTDDFYDGPETRMIGFEIGGQDYYFEDMPLIEEGINHVSLPEEVDTPEFRKILRDVLSITPQVNELLFNDEEAED